MRIFPQLKAIAAVSLNGVLGVENRIPWHISEELAFFKSITFGHTILMGRRTFQSLGKLLPQRKHWVLSHDGIFLKLLPTEVRGFASADAVLASLEELPADGQIWVIGGESIYEQFLPHCSELILTRIGKSYDGDRHWNGQKGFYPQEILCKHPQFLSQRWTRSARIQK